ncbi:MAG TPA: class I SAM-dependent methyltransferase [Beijerinckiaceae bacterium]|jgi:ubiquinone/menaquinone biosynthesis C-methylase UbiE
MDLAQAIDGTAVKNATRDQWDRSAPGWNSHGPQIRAWLAQATAAMIDMAGIRPGHRVLDVAAGAGDQTLDIAARVGPQGSVLATDISAAILAFAAKNARQAGYANVETLVADGEALGLAPSSFDAAVSRLGLMFFPDPLQGLREIHRALKPGGLVCTMVFSSPQANPCVAAVMQTALKHAGQAPADPFRPGSLMSLGKPGLIDDLFRQAGFADVATTKVSAPFRLPSARDYLAFIRSSASPVLQILGRLDEAAREAAWVEMEEKLQAFNTSDGAWAGPNELLLTAGRR